MEPTNLNDFAIKYTTFPDLTVMMDRLAIDGRTITYHWTLIGTNTSPGGTGKPVRISGYEEWRIGVDGLIAEFTGHFDSTDCDRQLRSGAEDTP